MCSVKYTSEPISDMIPKSILYSSYISDMAELTTEIHDYSDLPTEILEIIINDLAASYDEEDDLDRIEITNDNNVFSIQSCPQDMVMSLRQTSKIFRSVVGSVLHRMNGCYLSPRYTSRKKAMLISNSVEAVVDAKGRILTRAGAWGIWVPFMTKEPDTYYRARIPISMFGRVSKAWARKEAYKKLCKILNDEACSKIHDN